MPIYHSTATVLGVIPALIIGSTVCVGHKFSTKNFWPEVRASKSTIIQYVGETCRYLLAKQPQIDPATGKNLDKVHNVRMAFGYVCERGQKATPVFRGEVTCDLSPLLFYTLVSNANFHVAMD